MLYEIRTGAAQIIPVPDQDYGPQVRRLIRSARERVWCSLFIVEINPDLDPHFKVPAVLRDLAAARWRGVDTRLIVSGSRTTLLIAEAVAGALRIARDMGIPARTFGLPGQRGSHMKMVIADDAVLTGSHNWSPGALQGQVQDSLLLHSPDLAAYLSNLFLEQWRRAQRNPQPKTGG